MTDILAKLTAFVYRQFATNLTKKYYDKFYRQYLTIINNAASSVRDHSQNHTPSYHCCHEAWRAYDLISDTITDLEEIGPSNFIIPQKAIQVIHLYELCSLILLQTHFLKKLELYDPLPNGLFISQVISVLTDISIDRVGSESRIQFAFQNSPNRFLNQVVNANILEGESPFFDEILEWLQLGKPIKDVDPNDTIKNIINQVQDEFFTE